MNYIILNEEVLNIPIIEPENISEKSSPPVSNIKNNNLEIEILNDKISSYKDKNLINEENSAEPLPFSINEKKENKTNEIFSDSKNRDNKNINNQELIDKKPKKKRIGVKINKLKRYRVQLGSFRDKEKAMSVIKRLNLKYKNIFEINKLELYTLKRNKYLFYRVWTSLMVKKNALEMCKKLKDLEINCILQIDKNNKL